MTKYLHNLVRHLPQHGANYNPMDHLRVSAFVCGGGDVGFLLNHVRTRINLPCMYMWSVQKLFALGGKAVKDSPSALFLASQVPG